MFVRFLIKLAPPREKKQRQATPSGMTQHTAKLTWYTSLFAAIAATRSVKLSSHLTKLSSSPNISLVCRQPLSTGFKQDLALGSYHWITVPINID